MKPPAQTMTPEEYIARLPAGRRETMQALHDLIRKTVPKLTPFVGNGIGYGPYHYRYASGREGDAAVVGLVSQKQHLSLYTCAVENGQYLAEKYRDRLPNADHGKSCIRFKKLQDLDLGVIKKLLKDAQRLGGAGAV